MSQRDRIRLEVEEKATQQQAEAELSSVEHDTPQRQSAPNTPAQNILQMQRTLGNRAVQRLLGQVQRVPYENGGELDDDLSNQINSSRGNGSRLDGAVSDTMSDQLGHDFSGVNVHTDSNADRLSRSIGAKAFTTGSDIFFKQGAYSPGSSDGQSLLAHELTHVVQQDGQAPAGGKLTVGPANDSYESEADSVASSLDSAGAMATAQRMSEEEALQMKRDDVQRQGELDEEEDELLMPMRDDVQRQDELEEEEEALQMKRDDVQRQEDEIAL